MKKIFYVFLLLTGFNFTEYKVLASPIEDKNKEDLSLSDLLSLTTEVSSLFKESDLYSASSVGVVTQKDWRKLGARRTYDALGSQPSMIVGYGVSGTQFLFTRGFLTTSLKGQAMLFEGVPLNTYAFEQSQYAYTNINLALLEKFEYIRGPGSTLYGSDAFHGVVSMKAWNPDKNVIEGGIGYGSFNYFNSHLRASKELLPKLRSSVAFGYSDQSNMNLDYNYTNTRSATDIRTSQQKRAFLSYGVLSRTNFHDLELIYMYGRYKTQGWPALNLEPIFYNGSQGNITDYYHLAKISYSLNLPLNIKFDPSVYFGHSRFETAFNSASAPLDDAFKGTYGTNAAKENHFGTKHLFRRDFSEDVPSRFVFGYSYDFYKVLNSEFSLPPAYGIIRPTDEKYSTKSRGIHALLIQTDTRIYRDIFQLTAGARWDVYSEFKKHLSPRIGFIVHPSEETAIKIIYNHGYLAPSASEKYGLSAAVVGNDDIKAETLDTYELTAMKQNKTYSAKISGFYSRYEHGVVLQTQTTAFCLANVASPICQRNENLGKLYAYGGESEFQYKLPEYRLAANFSGSYIRSLQVEPVRMQLKSFPRIIINWGADYEAIAKSIKLSVMNRHQITQSSAPENYSTFIQELPDYFRTDLDAIWYLGAYLNKKHDDFEANLNIQNLFNMPLYQPSMWGWNSRYGVSEPGIIVTMNLKAKL